MVGQKNKRKHTVFDHGWPKKHEMALKIFQDFLKDSSLHDAAINDEVKMTELLILLGADVNATDKNGDTPLNLAATHGNAKIVKILLEHGAKKDLKDSLKSARLQKWARWGGEKYDAVINLLKHY